MENIDPRLLAILTRNLHIKDDQIKESSFLSQDLGADSLDTTEILIALEEEFGVRLEEDEVKSIKTVSDLMSAIQKAQNKAN